MESRDLLNQSQTVLISLPVRPTERELLDVFTFVYVLHVLEKKVKIEGDLKERARAFWHIVSQKEKTFSVSLKGLAPWVSQVQYEKEREDLKLIFTLKQGEITPANLAFDIPSQKDLTIIVRDGSAQSNENTLSHLLPASLSLLSKEKQTEALLAGRLLSKLEYFPGIQLHASRIKASDFEETNTTPKALTSAMQHTTTLLNTPNLVTFFEREEKIQGLLWSTRPRIQQKMTETWNGQIKDKWVLFSTPSNNLTSIQEHIQFLL
ncbi:MAG: hypothetical protein QF775_04245 [archaeon]|nr:hypothetical protein [archaeon]